MFDIIELMAGETYKTEMDEAWKRYSSKDTFNNDSAHPPATEECK